jgi:hypothetical protein
MLKRVRGAATPAPLISYQNPIKPRTGRFCKKARGDPKAALSNAWNFGGRVSKPARLSSGLALLLEGFP